MGCELATDVPRILFIRHYHPCGKPISTHIGGFLEENLDVIHRHIRGAEKKVV